MWVGEDGRGCTGGESEGIVPSDTDTYEIVIFSLRNIGWPGPFIRMS
jgi:hypothetical protein